MNTMSVNNISAVSDAVKYLNGQEISPKNSSILSPVKDAVTSPTTLIFAVGPSKRAIKEAGQVADAGGKVKFIDAFKNLKNAKIGADGMVEGTDILVSKSLKKQISHAADQLAKPKAAKAAADVAETAGKKGFMSTIKNGLGTVKTGAKTALSKVPGVSKLVDGTAKTAVKKGVGKVFGEKGVAALSKAKGVFKGSGAGVVAVIDGGIEMFTQVIPAFKQGGAKAGMKQVAKSGVKVAAGAGGWAAGSAVGKGVGAWIGGIIGGFFGGVGAAPGAAIGGAIGSFLGGIIGSGVASKVAEKATGKSEVEKIQEQQTEAAAQEISNDPNQMNQLKTALTERVNSDIANGTVTEDTEKMANYLNSGVFGSNVTTTTNTTANPTTTTDNSNKTDWLNEEYNRIKNGGGAQAQSATSTAFKGNTANNAATSQINFYG